jgi:hypothetical protein
MVPELHPARSWFLDSLSRNYMNRRYPAIAAGGICGTEESRSTVILFKGPGLFLDCFKKICSGETSMNGSSRPDNEKRCSRDFLEHFLIQGHMGDTVGQFTVWEIGN